MRRFERADGALWTAALAMPAALTGAALGIAEALVGACAACAILYCIARAAARVPADFRLPGWYGALRCGWCAVCAGGVLALARGLFPQAGGSWLIPAVLAALAAWASARDGERVRCVGAVVWPFVLAMLALVAVFALPQTGVRRLAVPVRPAGCACALALCLVPGMAPLRPGQARMRGFFALACALTALPGAICLGMLGRAQTCALAFPLYDAAKLVSVFGVMERFEVLLSGALAVSAFCALGFLFRTGVEGLRGRNFPCRAWALAAASMALGGVSSRLPWWVFAAGNALFCGLLPLGILLVAVRKKVEEKE